MVKLRFAALQFRHVRRSAPSSRIRYRTRPQLELLEDRRVPTLFTVNSLADGAPAADGQLTLREAITAAVTNAASGDAPAGQATLDTITFAPNLAFGTIILQGQLNLTGGGDVRIVGPVAGNAAGLVLNGRGSVRVLDVTSAAGAVSIENLTFTRGSHRESSGGGLLNAGGNTALSFVDVTNCLAEGASGGGIANSGGLSLIHCTVAGNNASQAGGGIFQLGPGTLVVNYSRIVGNVSSEGGGIATSGPNPATTIKCSTVAENDAIEGGGIGNTGGTMTVLRSTISGNRGESGGAGGVFNGLDATLSLINCTIAGNISTGVGGGVRISSGSVTVVQCTIVNNADTSNDPDGAGGISKAGGTLVLANSIVALNDAAPASVGGDVDVADITTNNNNFIGGGPALGPLQNNGGPTQTMAPLPGSPVIERGTNSFSTLTGLAGGTPILRDQRGARRIINGKSDGHLRVVDQGAVEFSPGPVHPLVVGSGPGGSPRVQVYDGLTGTLTMDFLAFPSSFTGGVRVAAGDLNLDGVDEIVAAAGPGGSPTVNVYNGVTGALVISFIAFNPVFTGGVQIAVGDVNRDGFADVIAGVDAGGAPVVVVYDGSQLAQGHPTAQAAFLAFNSDFTGGVRVAAGDTDGDGFADVIAAKGPGAAPRVKVFSGQGLTSSSQTLLLNVLAYPAAFAGGVYVAAGDTDGDGKADIITGAGAGGGPDVEIFSGATAASLGGFFAFGPGFTGGVRVGAADLNGDGLADIITGKGPGSEPTVKVFDGRSRLALTRFDALDAAFAGGVFVGGA